MSLVKSSSKGNAYVKVSLNGVKDYGLLDCGATVSIVSNLTYEKWRSNGYQSAINVCSSTTQHLSGVTGSALKVMGKVENVPILLGSTLLLIDLFVVENCAENVILGRDFLQKYKFVIDYNQCVLTNDLVKTPILSLASEDFCLQVVAEDNYNVEELIA